MRDDDACVCVCLSFSFAVVFSLVCCWLLESATGLCAKQANAMGTPAIGFCFLLCFCLWGWEYWELQRWRWMWTTKNCCWWWRLVWTSKNYLCISFRLFNYGKLEWPQNSFARFFSGNCHGQSLKIKETIIQLINISLCNWNSNQNLEISRRFKIQKPYFEKTS